MQFHITCGTHWAISPSLVLFFLLSFPHQMANGTAQHISWCSNVPSSKSNAFFIQKISISSFLCFVECAIPYFSVEFFSYSFSLDFSSEKLTFQSSLLFRKGQQQFLCYGCREKKRTLVIFKRDISRNSGQYKSRMRFRNQANLCFIRLAKTIHENLCNVQRE